MADMKHSVLDDGLFSVRRSEDQVDKLNLPEILGAIAGDDLESFEALQAHQRQPWHSFLAQLSAMLLARNGLESMPEEPAKWREMLVAMTNGSEAPWHLVVDDPNRPAFLQSPIPEGSLDEANYKLDIQTPDGLDMLVTSKNVDVKMRRVTRPQPEHWIFALLTLQTLEGFLGRGNYGIARMNGGFGNRPFVGATPRLGWSDHIKRDVSMLLAQRPELVEERYDDRGIALIWTKPWDGSSDDAIPLENCDPYFIEICRRLRFVDGDQGLECWRANSGDYRIAGVRDLNGLTGDPWTPIDVGDSKALTVSGSGFDYRLIHRILFGDDLQMPPAAERSDSEHEAEQAYLIAMTLVRGQGKTEGLHRRVIPIPSEAWSRFETPSEREEMAEHSSWRVEKASDVSKSVLRSALYGLFAAGRDADPSQLADKSAPWIDQFDDAVDERFFDDLWRGIEMGSEEARTDWEVTLRELARDVLEEAIDAAPLPQIRRWRAISDAESRFWNGVYKHLERTVDTDKQNSLTPEQEAV